MKENLTLTFDVNKQQNGLSGQSKRYLNTGIGFTRMCRITPIGIITCCMQSIALCCLLAVCVPGVYAQDVNFLWAQSMGGTGADHGVGVTTDANGNVYVTGYYTDPVATFGSGTNSVTLVSAGQNDAFVAKYNASGILQWAQSMGGASADQGFGVAVDANGNVYVTGSYASPGATFGSGTNTVTLTAEGIDGFVAKYDAGGTFQWAQKFGSVSWDQGQGVAVDATGNVYVVGRFQWDITFGSGTNTVTLNLAGINDGFVAKYDSGGTLQWAQSMGGTGNDMALGVAADAAGNVYVTGFFPLAGATFGSGTNTVTLTSTGGNDAFVAKYNTGGTLQWAQRMGGTGADQGMGVAADATGNVYVTGFFNVAGASFGSGTNTVTLTSAGLNDAFVAKYDAGGTFGWAKSMGGTGAEQGLGVAADATGNVYVTGYFNVAGASFGSGTNTITLTSAGGNDAFVAKLRESCQVFATFTESTCDSYTFNGQTYTSSGTYVDTFTSSGNCDSIVTLELTIRRSSNNPVVSGNYCNSVTFNGQTYSSSGTYVQQYTNAAGCDSNITYNLTIGSRSNNPVVSGNYCNSVTFNGQTYSSSGTYVQQYTNAAGCDSNITYNLTIRYSSNNPVVSGHYCDSVTFNGVTYTSTGTYVQQYPNATGCDSNITYNLTIGSSSNNPVVSGDYCNSVTFNGQTYSSSGTYVQQYTNAGGCDSSLTYDITINNSPEALVTLTDGTLSANGSESYLWVDCNQAYGDIPEATDKDYTPTETGSYAVIITENGCSDTSDCVYVEVDDISIRELGVGNKIQLYPNPTDSRVTIQTEQALKNATIRLVNVVGQLLTEQANQQGMLFTLDMNGYASGVYFVEISEGKNVVRMKVVKE